MENILNRDSTVSFPTELNFVNFYTPNILCFCLHFFYNLNL